MAGVLVRPYLESDEEGFYVVRSATYNNGNPVPPDRRKNPYGDRFVAEIEGRIAGIFSTLHMNVTRGPATLKCAGVAAVAVSPQERRSGVGQEMMRWSVNHFRASGYQLACLYAFREPFYAKSGYAVCGKRLQLSVPVHRLPTVESRLSVRSLLPSDWLELNGCYEQFAHARSGVNVRSQLMWERVLAENQPLAI